jgi:hypothetical protein
MFHFVDLSSKDHLCFKDNKSFHLVKMISRLKTAIIGLNMESRSIITVFLRPGVSNLKGRGLSLSAAVRLNEKD